MIQLLATGVNSKQDTMTCILRLPLNSLGRKRSGQRQASLHPRDKLTKYNPPLVVNRCWRSLRPELQRRGQSLVRPTVHHTVMEGRTRDRWWDRMSNPGQCKPQCPEGSPTHERGCQGPRGPRTGFCSEQVSLSSFLLLEVPTIYEVCLVWFVAIQGKDWFSLLDSSRQKPRGFRKFFLSEGLESRPPSPSLPPFHTLRG